MTAPQPDNLEPERAAIRARHAELLDPANVPYLDTPEQSQARASAALVVAKAAGRVEKASDAKAFATLQAKAAIKGWQVERMADGSVVVARWTLTRSLQDVAALEQFLRQVGAA